MLSIQHRALLYLGCSPARLVPGQDTISKPLTPPTYRVSLLQKLIEEIPM